MMVSPRPWPFVVLVRALVRRWERLEEALEVGGFDAGPVFADRDAAPVRRRRSLRCRSSLRELWRIALSSQFETMLSMRSASR